jgi:N-acetylmuramoyl-L-alanine amidase
MSTYKNKLSLGFQWVLGMLFLCLSAESYSATITNARVWPAPDHTRLVFEVSAGVDHKLFTLSNPSRIVLDLSNVKSLTDLSDLSLNGSPIKRIRTAVRNKKDLRVVLDISRSVTPKSFSLKPNQQYGNRLVVDLHEKKTTTKKPKIVKSVDQQKKRDIIVVIDAGHGGEDPGALGPGRVREKTVVLAIAKELQKLVNSKPGFKAKMTRNGDYYIGLRQRTKLARKYNADLFVSIHADAFHKPQANGASVYALSKRGSTSEAARWLAKKENSADLIGGVISLDDKDDILASVLLDLSMTGSLRASLGVGSHVLKSMGRMTRLHKKGVEQAGFVVLKSPDIPSILVETGFISNPSEAKRLKTRKYQKQMASAIFKGVNKHFTATPPQGSLLAYQQYNRAASSPKKYKIQRGDTLSGIAKNHQVTLSQLKRENRLQTDTVKVGQVLRIPAS